jgi:DNA repair protein RecN (Recombination protein N)
VLLRLHIENLALIEHAELELDPGLNVLTGETGAGKTMLAQAIGLIAGVQPAAEMVGAHGDESYVEAEFAVPEEFFADHSVEAVAALRPEGEETLVVARRLSRAGRSRALVWGRSCARADLQAIGERLLEISSQHEARRMARPGHALDLLDDYADLAPARRAMADAWSALRACRAELERQREATRDAERRRSELEGLVEAIAALVPEPGERDRLSEERQRLRHLDDLRAAAGDALQLLNPDDGDGAQLLAGRAAELVGGVEEIEPRLAATAGELRDVGERLQEAAIELRSYLDELEADPARLDWIEDRLAAFGELERRHGLSIDGVVELAADAQVALQQLDGDGGRLAELQSEVEAAERRAKAAAAKLSRARASALPRFTRDVESELADLGMEDAKLEPVLESADMGARGTDALTLLIAANPGLPAAPLSQTASGGELSRIALAIRVAARSGGGPATLLLDEVDAGVGGRTANAVGEKLKALAASAQLLCITHLPQIAAYGSSHFLISKTIRKDRTMTGVARLAGPDREQEMARMIGGADISATVLASAREMLEARGLRRPERKRK